MKGWLQKAAMAPLVMQRGAGLSMKQKHAAMQRAITEGFDSPIAENFDKDELQKKLDTE